MSQWGEPRIFGAREFYPTNPIRYCGSHFLRIIPLVSSPMFDKIEPDSVVEDILVLDNRCLSTLVKRFEDRAREFIGKPYRDWLARPNDEIVEPYFDPADERR